MNKSYLPSKQFVVRILALLVIAGVILGIYYLVLYFKNRPKKTAATTPQTLLVSDIIQKDSNNNGIPDWEEVLWGLDPTKDGDANKTYIEAQKKALDSTPTNNSIADTDTGPITSQQNDALSAEFFALILSLQQSGQIDNSAIQSMSDALGKTIIPQPIPDKYISTAQKIIPNATKPEVTAYFNSFEKLFTTYTNDKKMGKELSFISSGISTKDPQALGLAGQIGTSYEDFASDLIKIPVPNTIAPQILSLVNDYDKIGQSVKGMAQALQDPIVGMQSLINYKKYNDAAEADANNLPQNL